VWDRQIAGLSARLPTRVAEHRRGAGSLEALAATLLQSHAGLLALAGHSMGGRIALEAARTAPERIVGLALLDTGYLGLSEGSAGTSEVNRRRALVQLARDNGMRAMLSEWIQGMVAPGRLADRELVEAIIAMMAGSPADEFASQVEALIRRPDASDVLRRCKAPALVLCGALDTWSPPAQHTAMAALLANAELRIIADCGHMSPMEQPAVVLAHLLEWINRLGN
jgi:pimeloyl-ACP methyl ester carboxylesterase